MNSVVSRVVHMWSHFYAFVRVHVVPAGATRALGLGLWVWSSLSMVTADTQLVVHSSVYGLQSRVPYLTAHQALGHPWPLMFPSVCPSAKNCLFRDKSEEFDHFFDSFFFVFFQTESEENLSKSRQIPPFCS